MSKFAMLVSQFLDTSLRVALLDAGNVRLTTYDTGWRMLPYTLICQWHEGCAIHECEGASPRMVRQDDAMVIPAGTFHRTHNADDSTSIIRWTHMRFSLFEAIDLISLLDMPPLIAPPVSCRLGEMCRSLHEIVTSPPSGWVLPSLTRKKSLEMEILAEIVSIAEPKATSVDLIAGVQHLAPVLHYIEEHFTEPLRRATLADVAHLSPGYFDALFKRTMRTTPQEYIKRLRIRRAQELLIHTDLPVAAIAEQVGFNDPFHFSRQFHAISGVSPSGYRHQFRPMSVPQPYLSMRMNRQDD